MDSNITNQINIISKTESSLKCDLESQNILMSSQMKNFSLEEELLKPGELNLFGKIDQNINLCKIILK